MRIRFVSLALTFLFLLLGGCISSYQVEIIKVHEMIQDMEAIELDQPDHASDLPDTGILVNNNTNTAIHVNMRRKKEQIITIPPGGSATMALDPGNYHYKISAVEPAKGEKSKGIYIDLRGTKKIVGKILYIYDVFTKQEVVKEEELEELRSR